MLSPDWFASLRDRSVRDQERHFLCEGFRFLLSALQNRSDVVGLAVCPELISSPYNRRFIRCLDLPKLELGSARFRELSRSSEPQGVLVAARQKWQPLIEVRADQRQVHLVLDSPRTPGNLGTIVRTCEAFSIDSIWIIGGEADPYDPVCVRATMGAIFSQRLVRTSCRAIEGWTKRHRCHFVGASADALTDIRSLRYTGPIALVMGSERTGMRPRQAALCQEMVRIPMSGPTDSLNLAVATSIALYEVFSQRHPGGICRSYPSSTQ